MDRFIDLHCHSTLRPFGNTFKKDDRFNTKSKSSIWYYDKPSMSDKLLDIEAGFAKFSQADFTTVSKGNVTVLGVSLYSPEVEFFDNKLGDGSFDKWLENLITSYSKERVAEITSPAYRYFDELQAQYKYLESLHNKTVEIDGENHKFILINKFSDLENIQTSANEKIIAVFVNIEGGHSLGSGQPNFENKETQILKNVDIIKKWKYKPVYLTLTHHFMNKLAGHCRSLPDAVNFLAPQQPEMNETIFPLGLKVINKLLDNTNGKRILVDVKHLSTEGRKLYYELLGTKYANQNIPIIFSHGGLNGLKTFDDAWDIIPETKFNNWDIGLFEEEVPIIAKSKGIIGLNMDERVMSSKKLLKETKGNGTRYKMRTKYSKLIWNHIQRIAEILDENNLPAWDFVSLGTDFDGQINAINGFWTLEYMNDLETFLNVHAQKYMQTATLKPKNMIPANDIVQKFMCKNAEEFLKQVMV